MREPEQGGRKTDRNRDGERWRVKWIEWERGIDRDVEIEGEIYI